MGLGKTLSIIALIASDQDRDAGNPPQVGLSAHADELHSTLIVVPLNGEDNLTPISCLNNNPVV